MENHTIEIKNLTTGFKKKRDTDIVLQQNINTRLFSGESVFLLGVNGSGKSTLLRTLLGLHKPIEGEIFYDGISLTNINEKELSRKVSVIFTGGFNDNYLTVYDVVAMGRYPFAPLSGKLSETDKKSIRETLQHVGMAEFSSKIFSNLSDGEKQKVLIARALVQETPFMFFDEPAAFIDAPGKIAVMELLSDIAKNQNKGVLITTHDIDIALKYADKIWLLGKGKPFVAGIPEDLVLEGFIGKYFNRKDIVFNEYGAVFEKKRKKSGKPIAVAGVPLKRIWLANALKRNGFDLAIINKNSIDNGIYCGDSKFEIINNGKTEFSADSIEKVLENICGGNKGQ